MMMIVAAQRRIGALSNELHPIHYTFCMVLGLDEEVDLIKRVKKIYIYFKLVRVMMSDKKSSFFAPNT